MKNTILIKNLILFLLNVIYSYVAYFLIEEKRWINNEFVFLLLLCFTSILFLLFLIFAVNKLPFKNKLWFILSELILSFLIIEYFLTIANPFRSLDFIDVKMIFPVSIFLSSFLGGIITFYNFIFITRIKIFETRKYILYNILISISLPLIIYLGDLIIKEFRSIVGYWTYLSFSPILFCVFVWQAFNYYFLSKLTLRDSALKK